MEAIELLYIEDEAGQRRRIARGLRDRGFVVRDLPSGKAGLEQLEHKKADAVLCDLNMPGMSGLEVLRRTRVVRPEIPFILLTGHGSIPVAVQAIKEGAYDFLLKPLDLDQLARTVHKAIEKEGLSRRLHESEALVQLILEEVPDIIYSMDPTGTFLSVSPAGEAILGYRPSEIVGTSVFEYIHPEDRDYVKTGFMESVRAADPAPRTIEFRMLSKSGEEKHFEVNRRLIVEDGKVIRSDGIARDITQRKELEEELKRYSCELEQMVQERTQGSEYANRQLAALTAVSNRFTQIFDEDELFNEVPELLTNSLDFDGATLLLEEDGQLTLRSYCFKKDPPDLVRSFVERAKAKEVELAPHFQESFQQGRTHFIPDLNADPRWPREPEQIIRTKAVVISPIRVQTKAIGLIVGNMQHHDREMNDQDVARFEMFANMVGLALDNIRAYQSLEKKVIEKTKALRRANNALRQKAKELEEKTFSLASANIELLAVQEQLEDKNAQLQKLLTELSTSKDELQALLDASLGAIIMVNPQGRIIATNRRIRDFFALEMEDYLNQPVEAFSKKITGCFEDFGRFSQLYEQLRLQPDPVYEEGIEVARMVERELKVVHPENRYIAMFSVPVLDRDDHELGRVWIFRDITKTKQADEQLRTIVEASPIPFIVSRLPDGKILYGNQPLASLLGMDAKELIGLHTPDFYDNPDDRRAVLEAVKRGGILRNQEVRIKKADGGVVWMLVSAVTTDLSGERVLVGALYDITERKRAEQELQRVHEIYRDAIENAEGVPYRLDFRENRYDFIGAGCEGLLGVPADQLSFEKIKELVQEVMITSRGAPTDPHDYSQAFLRGDVDRYRVDLRMLTPSGEEKWVSDCFVPLRDERTGEVVGSLGIMQDVTERKRAEDKLRLYREIVMNSKDAILVMDPEGRILETNASYEANTGYSIEEVRGKTPGDFVGGETFAEVGKALVSKGSFRGEITTRTRHGSPFSIELSAFSIRDEEDRVVCHVGFGRDITERKRAEREREALQRLSQRLTGFLNVKEVGEILARESRLLFGHHAFLFDLFDEPSQSLIGIHCEDTLPGTIEPVEVTAPQPESGESSRAVLASEPRLVNRDSGSNGIPLRRYGFSSRMTRSLMFAPIRWENHGLGVLSVQSHTPARYTEGDLKLLQTFADQCGGALARVRTEVALRKSEERFRGIVENANDIIYVLTTDGRFSYVSPNWTDILGHDLSEIQDQSFLPIVHPDDRQICLGFLQKVVETGQKRSGIEYRLKHKDGSWRWHTTSASPLKDDEGKVLYFIGISHDITEMRQVLQDLAGANRRLRETQAQLVQSEKMAALGNLVAGIAHEINTPIGAVYSMHDTLNRAVDKLKSTLAEECAVQYEQSQALQVPLKVIEDASRVIEEGSQRVTTIVKRLKSFARLDEAELKRIDVHEGLEDTLTLVHYQLKNRITVKREFGEVATIACYPGRLNQVFLNLLVNGIQAISGPGEIILQTRQQENEVWISFRDTGVGIPPEDVEKIFDPGFTTKGVGVGTGLGLSICYQIVQDHQGRIEVESQVGQGSTFTVVLPADLDKRAQRT